MKLLSNLDLSNNQLEELDLETRNALDQLPTDTLIVRLIGNDLKCCCKKLELLIWMRNSKKVHFTRMINYTCSFEKKCDFSFVNLDKIIQKLEKIGFSYTYTRIILLMTTFIIVIIMITISRILYRLWRSCDACTMWLRGNTKLKPMR